MKNNLIWIDIETSGLNPHIHKILEIAVIATDSELNIMDKGISRVIGDYDYDNLYKYMDSWCKTVHSENGLLHEVSLSPFSLFDNEVEQDIISYIRQHVPPNESPMCGNSVHFDRNFLRVHFPFLEVLFHYRNLDVSTLKILANQWYPHIPEYPKANHHRAMPDLYGSIAELHYYRQNILKEV